MQAEHEEYQLESKAQTARRKYLYLFQFRLAINSLMSYLFY